jgi:hypothetical protein
MNGKDKKGTASLKGQCRLSRVSKNRNEDLTLKKIGYLCSRGYVTFSEWTLSIEFIYFVEYLPEINCLDRVASANCMCTRLVLLRDMQFAVTSNKRNSISDQRTFSVKPCAIYCNVQGSCSKACTRNSSTSLRVTLGHHFILDCSFALHWLLWLARTPESRQLSSDLFSSYLLTYSMVQSPS